MDSRFLQIGRNLSARIGTLRKYSLYGNILLIALGSLLTFSYIVGHAVNILPFPFRDGVSVSWFLNWAPNDWVPFILATFEYGDNEHRPVFPLIIWQLDRVLFGGPGFFTSILIFIIVFVLCLMLAALFKKLTSFVGYLGILTAIAALMYSPGHFQNLIWWKQLHVYLSCFAALAALHLAANVDSRSNKLLDAKVMTAVVLALIASFSFGYGIVVWPLLVGNALFAHWRRHQWALLVAGILIFSFILLVSPTQATPSHGSVFENLMNPGAVLAYMFELSGFIARRALFFVFPDYGVALTRLFGLLMVLVALFGFVFAYLLGTSKGNGNLRAAVLISGFSIGSSLLTAISRVTVNEPIASRYLIISAIGFVATGAIISIWASKTKYSVPSGKGFAVTFSFIFIIFSISFIQSGRQGWKNWNNIASRGAIAADLMATDAYPLLYRAKSANKLDKNVWPNFVSRAHKSGRLLGFGRQGTNLKNAFELSSESCVGRIGTLVESKVQGHLFEVVGWARMGSHGQEKAEFVLFTDRDDIVVGVGTVRISRPDVAAHLFNSIPAFNGDEPEVAGFTALIRTNAPKDLKAYATNGKNACRLDVKVPDPTE